MTLPIAVVIPTWNSAAALPTCLQSASDQDAAEILVVDNGSTDGTKAFVREHFPNARLLGFVENRGFSVACNTGIAASSAAYVLCLNDDARLGQGYCSQLLDALERDPHAASAVGKLVYEREGRRYIDSAGIKLRRYALGPVDLGHGDLDCGQYDTPRRIFGPSATATLYRRAALQDAGPTPFDETFFAYYEDVDLAWRLNRRGWHHLYVPSAVCEHERRTARGKPREIIRRAERNRYRLWFKNESWWRFALYAPVALAWEAVRIAKRVLAPASR